MSSTESDEEDEGQEKVMFGPTLNDRRHKVISSEDKRAIIKCVGMVRAKSTNTGYGTGTVFKCNAETKDVFVITCAHNIVDKKDGKLEKVTSVSFQRRETYQSKKHRCVKEYKCTHWEYHPKYSGKKECEYDLAILVFRDWDEYYEDIFVNNTDDGDIRLFSSDKIHDDLILTYHIYGYPSNEDKYFGELWGMDNKSYSKVNGKEMYIRKNEDENMFYYNAIDTEGGQSGSAIFLECNNKNGSYYGIVGIHTGGYKKQQKNYGVALDEDNLGWINNCVNDLIPYLFLSFFPPPRTTY